MKGLIIILAVVSALLLLSTVICGAWIQFSGKPVEKSSLDFHLWIALASAGATLLTLGLAVVSLLRAA